MSKKQNKKLLTPEILKQALIGSVKKLDPRYMLKNPVMFVVEIGFLITLLLTIVPGLFGEGDTGLRTYNLIVSIILLVTVLFANFAESVAEGRGKAQAASLKKTQKDTEAHLLNQDGSETIVSSSELKKGDVVMVTLLMLLLCGFVFPVLLSGISAVLFPSQANGSLVYADGQAVGAANVGQDFTKPYFMKGRPSTYNYNTYHEDEQGNKYDNDGNAFAGLGSGSNNYAPSNPALTERVEADIEAFLEANPDVKREDIPADLMTASGSGLDPHITPESARIQIPALATASGLSEEQLERIVEDNTEGKLFGIFGEETVNVLGVNLDIAEAMGLVEGASR